MIYLDNAATTLIKPREVRQAAAAALHSMGSPGRGGHRFAMAAGETAFSLRERAAELFNVDSPEKVVITFNATHGLNIAIRSLVSDGDRVVVTGFEHNSVIRPLRAAGAVTDAAGADGETEDLIRRLPGSAACVVNHVSNVNGRILDIETVAEACLREGVPLVVDASQSAGAVDIDMKRLGAAFIAMPGHKGLYGPQGTGLLLVGRDSEPVLYGGSGSASLLDTMPEELPDRLEAGTHNMPGIAGLLAGIEFVRRTGTKRILAHERRLIRRAAESLSEIRGVRLYGSGEGAGVLSFTLDGTEPEDIAERLDKMGVAVRAGLHCAPLAHKTLGTLPSGTVRLSVSAFTSQPDIDGFTDAVSKIARL